MSIQTENEMIYPVHIRILNRVVKTYINTYWTIIDLLASKFQIISVYFYQKTIRDEYEREHNSIDLKKTDVILHIGCGFFPYSAIVLSKKNHNKIVAIDNNNHAIQHAHHIIHQKKLDTKIQLDTGEGSSYNLQPFSVIISSGCVDSTVNVLQNITNHAKPGTRIIIRELRPMSKYLKTFIKNQKHLTLEYQYSKYSFPLYSILGWDSFIITKTM